MSLSPGCSQPTPTQVPAVVPAESGPPVGFRSSSLPRLPMRAELRGQPAGVRTRELRMRRRARNGAERLSGPTESGITGDALMTAIVDSGFFSMIAIDLGGTIVQWNRAAERLLGWRASE